MLWMFVEVGSLLFWLLLAALVVWELVCIEYDKRVGSWLGMVAFVLAIWVFGNFDLIHFVSDNWSKLLVLLGGYFAAGVLWGFGKWEFWITKRRAGFDDFKRSWLDKKSVSESTVPQNLQYQWSKAVVTEYLGKGVSARSEEDFLVEYPPERIKAFVVPRVRDEKSRVMFWMTHWPFSLFWTLFRDVLAEMWNFIYYKAARVMDKRAQSHFKGVESEFAPALKADSSQEKR